MQDKRLIQHGMMEITGEQLPFWKKRKEAKRFGHTLLKDFWEWNKEGKEDEPFETRFNRFLRERFGEDAKFFGFMPWVYAHLKDRTLDEYMEIEKRILDILREKGINARSSGRLMLFKYLGIRGDDEIKAHTDLDFVVREKDLEKLRKMDLSEHGLYYAPNSLSGMVVYGNSRGMVREKPVVEKQVSFILTEEDGIQKIDFVTPGVNELRIPRGRHIVEIKKPEYITPFTTAAYKLFRLSGNDIADFKIIAKHNKLGRLFRSGELLYELKKKPRLAKERLEKLKRYLGEEHHKHIDSLMEKLG
ncbi:MAG: hypothetical protein J7K68_02085 [Candidatus Diapherotrites archaeon]|nr:hypothetical protein [Candidatus Diapherotrites archaeon]